MKFFDLIITPQKQASLKCAAICEILLTMPQLVYS